MNRNRWIVAAVLAAIGLWGLLAASSADAIPAFARKYQLSCSTCHAPFPRLKPYGEEFAGRGFKMEDPSKEPARATYDVGDPMLKLFRELPLAVRLDFYSSYKQDAVAEADFEWPWSMKLLSGGPISEKISYYFYAILEQGESIKLEDTFLQFSSVFGAPVDVVVGQFQVCDPLFKRELRLEREDFAILKARVGDSPVNLAYDRGMVVSWHAPGEVDVIGQLVNGNGIEPAEHDNFDNDSLKNVALRVVRGFGPVRLGLFGYRGKTEAEDGPTNTTTYFGPDVVAELGEKWQLSLQYLERRDDDPFFSGLGGDTYVTRGGLAELHFFPQGQDGRWAVSALYNKVDSDAVETRHESVALTLNRLLARTVRLMLEGARDLEHDRTRLSLGFVAAF
jgi:hypothetical protein